jgi:hypothetical protein
VKEGRVRIENKYLSWTDGEFFGEEFLLKSYLPPRAFMTAMWTDVIRITLGDVFDLLESGRFPRISVGITNNIRTVPFELELLQQTLSEENTVICSCASHFCRAKSDDGA